VRRVSPELAARYLTRSGPYSTLIGAINAGRGLSGRAAITGVRVDGLHVSRLERRRGILADAARRGYEAAKILFTHSTATPACHDPFRPGRQPRP
jgi:hypothetical protein